MNIGSNSSTKKIQTFALIAVFLFIFLQFFIINFQNNNNFEDFNCSRFVDSDLENSSEIYFDFYNKNIIYQELNLIPEFENFKCLAKQVNFQDKNIIFTSNMLYNFSIFYSTPTTSNSIINPNDTSQTAWPHNWGTYFSVKTPSYPMPQKINVSGLYGNWNNTGDVFQIDFTRRFNENTRGTVRGYLFNSNDNSVDSNNGIILNMQFKMTQPIFTGTT